MQSRISIILIAAISLTSIIACSSGNGPGASEVFYPPSQQVPGVSHAASIPATGGLCDNNLFPVRAGATWTYYSTGGPSGDYAYSDTITEVRADGFIMTTQFSNLTRTQQWSCLPDGLKALELGGGETASISAQNMTSHFTTLEVTGLNLPKEITSAMQWQYNLTMQGFTAMPGDQESPSTSTLALTMQELGRENITVPAGNFEAVKIQVNSIAQINADFQGVPVPYTMNGSSVIWYAPGIGFIKSIENIDISGTTYTTTTELQIYNIP